MEWGENTPAAVEWRGRERLCWLVHMREGEFVTAVARDGRRWGGAGGGERRQGLGLYAGDKGRLYCIEQRQEMGETKG